MEFWEEEEVSLLYKKSNKIEKTKNFFIKRRVILINIMNIIYFAMYLGFSFENILAQDRISFTNFGDSLLLIMKTIPMIILLNYFMLYWKIYQIFYISFLLQVFINVISICSINRKSKFTNIQLLLSVILLIYNFIFFTMLLNHLTLTDELNTKFPTNNKDIISEIRLNHDKLKLKLNEIIDKSKFRILFKNFKYDNENFEINQINNKQSTLSTF